MTSLPPAPTGRLPIAKLFGAVNRGGVGVEAGQEFAMAKRSVEEIKEESQYLRGSIPEQLASEADHFDDAAMQLLKFHGIYQQDDRDARRERKKAGLGLLYFFMVRVKLPGGKLSAEQYLVLDELCERHANGTLRLTTRQGIQFHGVFKRNLKRHLRALNDALVSTLAACGDVERNVMACPAPIRKDRVRDAMQALADRIAEHLCPRTPAYHEVWLNGEKSHGQYHGETIEPIYGKHYLPRKFKTGIALPEDNCVDVLSNDVGLVAVHDKGELRGCNVFVGGGMGMSHGNAKTYPRLATPLCYAPMDDLLDVITAIVKVQRDHGNREDRSQARMKYLIDRWGQEKFHDTVQEYLGRPLEPFTGQTVVGFDDHLGWHDQGDGKWWHGVHVVAGRIQDAAAVRLRTALREVVSRFRPSIRVTAQQNLLLCDVEPAARGRIDAILADHGVARHDQLSNLARQAMACPAMPTCHLALSDSERILPTITSMIESELVQLGLGAEEIILRMTGCPNGCARPYNCDIGIVGRQPGVYTLFLGGNRLGTTMSFQFRDLVKQADIPGVLRGPLLFFKESRRADEGFGDFCQRIGRDEMVRRFGGDAKTH